MVQRPTVVTRLEDASTEATLQIGLLGPLTLVRDGTAIELTGPKRRALLTFLALHAGVPISQERIVEALWPGRPTGREESTLQVHISHLRDALEADRAGPPSVVITRESAYMLTDDAVELDIARFDLLAGEARTLLEDDPEAALELLNRALRLWRGRPLQDVEYEEFAQDEIRRLEWARTEAVENRAAALVELNRDAAAVEDLEALVRVDPTRERPVRLLMRALYRTGRQAEALRVFRRHARHLVEQGLETSPSLNLLEERMLQHDPSLLPEEMLSPGDIAPGRSVRGYELREEVGSGAIGVVYRAFQAVVGREVAVKVVHPHLAQSPDFVRRFTAEARIVAGLEHPHIVPLHDFWREPAGAFLVMRWMDGGSLEERLGEPWDADELGRVFDQLADALGYAHSAGIVHRDVKPANVLFDTQGNTYLCDFGLAVPGIDTDSNSDNRPTTIEPPYASPELLRGEGPSVASDVYGLGILLAEAATGGRFHGVEPPVPENIREVVGVATARNPADRYPDMTAFRTALREAIGPTEIPAIRRVRRNPYKGLEPFDEGDRTDFYGRDDVVDTLIDMVSKNGLTAVIGASGSGKSSVVRAGLNPELRDGALSGSEEWFIVTMVPGRDPFEEFHLCLREAAVGYPGAPSDKWSQELRDGFDAALDGPNSKALLVIDQFEEVFSSEVDDETRQRFLDDLVDLALDPTHRIRILLTLRADFSDRPLAHPRFGELISHSSVLLAPMRPAQVEDVIRKPAARVGVRVEPGLISEIVRDVSSATAYLPHLQYVLAELFERRSEDRLTVQAYRSLGGVHGVLERRAEATYSSLDSGAQHASRQLFLRMVHLGEHGEETRRRLPLTDVRGLGDPADLDEALEAFAAARILTYDRDPVTRTPTVEVAHETVISQWTRFRVWIDEARSDILAHRRLSAAAVAWAESGEDPAYLLTGGPLAAALEIRGGDRISLNRLETRFVEESQAADEETRRLEEDRRREKDKLQHRARRRLTIGIGAAVFAVIVGVLAALAWNQRERANELATTLDAQSRARELAAASVANLDSADPNLSLLLAIKAAEQTIESGGEVLDEAVDALHLALVNPRPARAIDGGRGAEGGEAIEYSPDGAALAALADDGGAFVIDPGSGKEIGRIPPLDDPAFGVAVHADGATVLTTHADAAREWNWRTGELVREPLGVPDDVSITTAIYSDDGSRIAVGGDDGVIRIYARISYRLIAELDAHSEPVATIGFDPTGSRLASAANDERVLFWDITAEEVAGQVPPKGLIGLIRHLAWHPTRSLVVATGFSGEIVAFDPSTGERVQTYGDTTKPGRAVAFDTAGNVLLVAGSDGVARIYGALFGGRAAKTLPTGGVPLRDAAFNLGSGDPVSEEVATIDVDGNIRIWRDFWGSELPTSTAEYIFPQIAATPDGSRYAVVGSRPWLGQPEGWAPEVAVIDQASGETLFSSPSFSPSEYSPAAISADGSAVAWVGPEGDVRVAHVTTGKISVIPVPDSLPVVHLRLALSSHGELLAWADPRGPIRIWDLAEAREVTVLGGHPDARSAEGVSDLFSGIASYQDFEARSAEELAFLPGATELASVGRDGTVRAWSLQNGQYRVLQEFDYSVISLAYTADGSRMAAADMVGNVRVFDAVTGDDTVHLDSASGPVFDIAFSPTGDHLAGGGLGVGAQVWDASSGESIRRLRGSIYAPNGVMFTEDGDRLLVMSTEGVLRGYHLNPFELLEVARQEAGDAELTKGQCRRYLRDACDQ